MEAGVGSEGQVGVKNETFRATLATGIAGAVAAIGAAAFGLIEGIPQGTPPAVAVAAFALIGIGLLAFALVVSADIRARATVDVASLGARANQSHSSRPAGSSSAPGDSPRAENGKTGRFSLMVSTGARMGVTIGDESYAVVAIRVDPATEETRYLIAQPSSLPRWRGRDELDTAFFAEPGGRF